MEEIGKQYINAKTRAGFQTALDSGKVSDSQVAFIEDEDLIWARGKYYGTIPNEEDLTKDTEGKLQLSDRSYNPENFSGLGRIILRKNMSAGKNILTQEMISQANTVYEIRYDFDLSGATINIPENCTLDFQGGSLKNGTLNCNNTYIRSSPIKIFDITIDIQGTLNIEYFYIEYFGYNNKQKQDCSNIINKINKLGVTICLLYGDYYCQSDVLLLPYTNIVGINKDKSKLIINRLRLNRKNKISNLTLEGVDGNSSVIYIGLTEQDWYKEVTVDNINLIIKGINQDGIVLNASSSNHSGFYGVSVTNVRTSGNAKHILKLETENDGWITCCEFSNIWAHYGEYVVYINGNVNHCTFFNIQSEVGSNTKAFAFLDGISHNMFNMIFPIDYFNDEKNIRKIFYFNNERSFISAVNINCSDNINYNFSKYNNESVFNIITKHCQLYSDSVDGYNGITVSEKYLKSDPNSKELYYKSKLYFSEKINIPTNFIDIATHFIGISTRGSLSYSSKESIGGIGFSPNGFSPKIIKLDNKNNLKTYNIYSENSPLVCTKETDIIDPKIGCIYFCSSRNSIILMDNNGIWDKIDSYHVGCMKKGLSHQRPTKDLIYDNYIYIDTTLNKIILWNGEKWVDMDNNPADALKKGTTSQRPTGVQIGYTYKDTDLGKWIIWNGEAWENIDGSPLE